MRTLLWVAIAAFASMPQPARAVSCRFGTGATPAVTKLGKLHGAQIPIDTIVLLMQENRSFDHYMGHIKHEGQPRAIPVPGNASNPDPTNPGGPVIRPFLQTRLCESADLDHSWNGTHNEWDNGKMDGFTAANVDPTNPNGSRTMGYYDQATLPYYYSLYSTFAMADHYFAAALTQTFPNRLFFLAGTSFGHIRNDLPSGPTDFPGRSIFNLLDEANPPITYKIYAAQLPYGFLFAYVRNRVPSPIAPVAQFFTDAAAGTLPQVSYIDGIQFGTKNVENDEHPAANVQVGQKFVADAVKAFTTGPQWAHGAMFVTYDEHGGFYDHVKPRPACVPDDIQPMFQAGDIPGRFDRTGIRVPMVAISPYSRPNYVSHRVYDHTSILRFVETRFDLPALTQRDANADPMLRMFKFKDGAPFATPPTFPDPSVDMSRPECSPSGAFVDVR
jgi:phospholipase C